MMPHHATDELRRYEGDEYTMVKMHENEIITYEALVRRLVAAQFPQWVGLPVRQLTTHGTDNEMYRLGAEMVVRMPKIDWAVQGIAKEQRWLPLLKPYLPLSIPQPLAQGEPVDEYPYRWSITTWVPGRNPVVGEIADPRGLAREIARFVRAMQVVDLPGGPPPARRWANATPRCARTSRRCGMRSTWMP